MKKWLITGIISLILTVGNTFAQGCAQCKLLAEQGSELDESSFGRNINSGILYLMVLPYIIILIFLFRKRIIRFFTTKFSAKQIIKENTNQRETN